MLHGASLVADQRIFAGDMSEVATSQIVVITAGLRRKPDESRLDLINRNVDLFTGILDQMKSAGIKENTYVIVVSNPVDVLTYLAVKTTRLRLAARHRPGDRARHHALPQQSRQALQVPADAGQRPHPRRARRQHGADLVERRPSTACRSSNGPASTRTRRRKSSRRPKAPALRSSSKKAAPGSRSGCRSAKSFMRSPSIRGGCCRSARSSTGRMASTMCACRCPTEVGCGGVRKQIELALTPKERLGLQNSARVCARRLTRWKRG